MLRFWIALALAVSLAPPALSQGLDDKRSPFEALRYEDGAPEVRIGETWYEPLAIDELTVERLLEFCGERWPGQVEKRFREDLVEAMVLLGAEPGPTVDIVARPLEGGAELTLALVPMTREHREALRAAASPPRTPRPSAPSVLARDRALQDLEQFERDLRRRFAYLDLGGVELDQELERIASAVGDSVDVAWFAEQLNFLLMKFGDGHAGVSSASEARERLFAPFLLQTVEGGVVALLPDRSGFLDADRPFVLRLDGDPLDAWIESVAPTIAAGSPQLVRRRALGELREWNRARRARGLAEADAIELELCAAGGSDRTTLRVPLSERRPSFGSWPRTESGVLDGDIGYLRIPRMDDERIDALHASFAEFRETRGLILDVRGNGGGLRGLLLALGGYLRQPGAGPWVANVAAYRTPAFGADHLEARHMVPADHPSLSDTERRVVEAFAAGFEPELEPGPGFSPWHYLILGPTGHPAEYAYDRPVVVLCDAGCFSATDILLGALAELPQVTLMGSASSGGSARSQTFTLAHSGIRIQCASMASFRPDGRLYDGRGIEVDVEQLPRPEDLLIGGSDSVLEAARQRLGG